LVAGTLVALGECSARDQRRGTDGRGEDQDGGTVQHSFFSFFSSSGFVVTIRSFGRRAVAAGSAKPTQPARPSSVSAGFAKNVIADTNPCERHMRDAALASKESGQRLNRALQRATARDAPIVATRSSDRKSVGGRGCFVPAKA
jgi:hypothetical protein